MAEEQTSEKKQIKLDVKYRIKRGEPKQQILEDLSPLYKDKATLVKTIEITPSKAMQAKYGIYNYGLAALLFAALVLDVILLFKLEFGSENRSEMFGQMVFNFNVAISVVLDAVFLVGVLLYRIDTYSWIASRALVTLLTIIVSVGYYKFSPPDNLIYFSLGLIVISFVLGLMLGVKLCPSRVPKIIEIDIDENEKVKKTIYVFPD